MAAEGWVKLYRAIQEHWIWEDPIKLKWWLDIILLANHKDNKFLLGNELMKLEKGEFHTSEIKLSDRWNVNRKTVKKFLELLENDEMINVKRSKKGTTIKVSNYKDFQSKNSSERTTQWTTEGTTHWTDEGQHTGQIGNNKVDTNKNDKECIKNDKEWEEGKEEPQHNSISFPTSYHEAIFNQWGLVTYDTWFKDAKFIDKGEVMEVVTKDNLKKQMISERYSEGLQIIFNKKILVKEEF